MAQKSGARGRCRLSVLTAPQKRLLAEAGQKKKAAAEAKKAVKAAAKEKAGS